ncbi:MAG: hypothetical protein NPIRA05_20220 [Nitrospirales bacterium]|nr:MAG: hypothetical protein NPIRA05_20220 [Nitrospirales bacterium]
MKQNNENISLSALSLTLVGIQFILIGLIAYTGPLWPSDWSLRAILAGGGVVGLWALLVMALCQVNVFPEVSSQGKLIVFGPYRWIRHHLYQCLAGNLGLNSGKSASLPYFIVGGISDDLIGQTPLRRGSFDETIS